MKVQRIKLSNNQFSWLVLDNNYLPIKPIQQFLKYQLNIEHSPNTLRAYANHLKLYWEYLEHIDKIWTEIVIEDFASFVGWLRINDPRIIYLNQQTSCRTESTINTILTAISVFYEFHKQMNNTQITLTTLSIVRHSSYKPFLHHLNKNQSLLMKKKLIKLKTCKLLPKVLTKEQVSTVIASCNSLRDKFLLSLLYESGMRIGQILGLRHSDIKNWDNEIIIQPRNDNINGARCKSRVSYIVHISSKLMELYADYVLQECENYTQDYVFIQTKTRAPGKPLHYSAIRYLFLEISKKVGFTVNPHMFRHTHATELIRDGWDCSKIQKRLGHANIQTTLNIYSHLDTQDLKKAFISYQLKKEKE